MNIQKYISSGVLEFYAMDALSEAERREVEKMLEQYDELKQELIEIQETLESYALLHSVSPPSNVLDSLMASVEEKVTPLTLKKPPPSSSTSMNYELEKSKNTIKRLQRFQYLAVAASILLALSAALNWKYYTALEKAQTEIAFLTQEQETLANNFNSMQAKYNLVSGELEVLQNPNNRIVKMAGNENHPETKAYVYWNVESQEVYVKIAELPNPPTEKQYQLWALKDGKPIDAGVFDVENGLLKVKNIEAADAFAVTLEPKGGSEQPTLEDLYMIGEVKFI